MKLNLLDILRCPATGQKLVLRCEKSIQAEIMEGWLDSVDGRFSYPIASGIPRFVPASNYANNFGLQWNHFRQTQLDQFSGKSISANRFWAATGWKKEDLAGAWVLDAGCGAGRFAQVALDAGANVIALDYSSAVDACFSNLDHYPNLHVIQGDIFSLPLARGVFPFVYSLGVLQHTPDVKRAFLALPPMLLPNGKLCVDYYEKSFKSAFHIRHILRPITTRMNKTQLFTCLQKSVPALLPISQQLAKVPLVGQFLKRMIPVANHFDGLDLNSEQIKEWALLDTFDWFSPEYDQPQSAQTAENWMHEAKMKDVQILRAGHLVARGHRSDEL